jgi:sugar/nucleoside kinase (ribokinase family)
MPQIVGTGLVALDLIVDYGSHADRYLAGGGGTCANVLAALAAMGWQSTRVGAVRQSKAAAIVAEDLRAAGVEVEFVFSSEGSAVPVIVEHVVRSLFSRRARHWFSFDCPFCNQELPRFSVPADELLSAKAHRAHRTDVFFADRLSSAIVEMAASARQRGAFVMYEPSTISDQRWTEAMLGVAHVVKYSADYAEKLSLEPAGNALWIETHGAKGLRWKASASSSWKSIRAPAVPKLVDSCGAGDWFTAGLLFTLFETAADPRSATGPQLGEAIQCAALLAAWSCGFLGARGPLYDADSADAIDVIARAARVNVSDHMRRGRLRRPKVTSGICGHCEAHG